MHCEFQKNPQRQHTSSTFSAKPWALCFKVGYRMLMFFLTWNGTFRTPQKLICQRPIWSFHSTSSKFFQGIATPRLFLPPPRQKYFISAHEARIRDWHSFWSKTSKIICRVSTHLKSAFSPRKSALRISIWMANLLSLTTIPSPLTWS